MAGHHQYHFYYTSFGVRPQGEGLCSSDMEDTSAKTFKTITTKETEQGVQVFVVEYLGVRKDEKGNTSLIYPLYQWRIGTFIPAQAKAIAEYFSCIYSPDSQGKRLTYNQFTKLSKKLSEIGADQPAV